VQYIKLCTQDKILEDIQIERENEKKAAKIEKLRRNEIQRKRNFEELYCRLKQKKLKLDKEAMSKIGIDYEDL